ncbi:hypothetical protein amrb99_68030 [Actinomadura sp. RB99]|nr:hypothetical protein [Actinomadura sp. RB99]
MNDPGGGVTPCAAHQAPGACMPARSMPLLGICCGGMGGSLPESRPIFDSASSSEASFSSDMPIGPILLALRNCRTTGSSLDSSISRGPNIARCRWYSRPMLSGMVRAVLMSWVTIRNVALSCAFRSMNTWFRNAVRTGSRPESGSSISRISGSSTRARARPARFFIPPEISPGSLYSAPRRPTISIFSRTMRLTSDSDFLVCSRSGKAMLSNRFIDPNSAPSWNSTPNSLRVS